MTTQEAIDFFGTVRDLADALKITTQAVYAWGDDPPRLTQYQIQVLTGGALVAEEKAA